MNTPITHDMVTAYLTAEGIPCDGMEEAAAFALSQKISGAMSSQGKFAAWMIDIFQGNLTKEDLTDALIMAFPKAKIGPRHGAHYASYSRTGKLKGCRYAIPKAGRSVAVASELAKATALIEALRGTKKMDEVQALLAKYDA